MQLFLLTTLTMMAFAANSVFARLALGDEAIDPMSYSIVRLMSGAIMLGALVWRSEREFTAVVARHGTLYSGAALFLYAAMFSYAYVALETGMGALILFACVQATMIGWGIATGNRPVALEWLGLTIAFGAFVWLVSPGLTAPDPYSAALMAISGIAWGVYSLRGKGASDPLKATAGNFVYAALICLPLLIVFFGSLRFSTFGLLMAVCSGALTSGLGYALWYRCLRQLTATRAAIVQLTVPAIATLGGVLFSQEVLTLRLALCSALILGGVALAITARPKVAPA